MVTQSLPQAASSSAWWHFQWRNVS